MPTDSRELLAVGIFGGHSNLGGRIETLLRARRKFSPRASASSVAATAIALAALAFTASLAPHWIAFAQQARPAFEVISVKPNTSGNPRDIAFDVSPNGKLTSRNIPLVLMIATAYNLPIQGALRLTGAPDWTGRERFDIEATAPEGAFPPSLVGEARDARLRLMLQSLLADRFRLAIHSETKVTPVYAVVIAKNGPKLQKAKVQEKDCPHDQSGLVGKPADDTSCHTFVGGRGRGAHGQAVNLSDLALFVSNWADRPLVDKTGLKGLYRIDTQPWLPMNPGPPPAADAKGETGAAVADLPTIFGVFESLGLKLEAQQAPVEYFVIDHVEHPDAN